MLRDTLAKNTFRLVEMLLIKTLKKSEMDPKVH